MPSLGTTEFLIIGLGILLLFGAKKIPELMKGLGSGLREFKKAANDDLTDSGANKQVGSSTSTYSETK